MTTSLEIIFKACMSSKKIVVGERTIVITPKFSKRDFFESLNDMGKDTEKKYFDYFGYSEMAIKLYPTIKGIKDEYNIDYQKLSEIGKLNLKSILGHSSIMDTLTYYKGIDDLSLDNFDKTFKDGDIIDLGHNIRAQAFFTPGHNPSCITWKIGDAIFTGDSYIPGLKTVTNLPGGNKAHAEESVALIKELSKDKFIYPGHEI